jgi:lipid A 3-O-deacylase
MHTLRHLSCLAAAAAALTAAPALADELYLGVSEHAIDTPLSLATFENGQDLQLGYRTAPIEGLRAIGRPSAYLHGQVSLDGETSLAAAGLSWKIGNKIYLRPGIGLAIHTDKISEFRANGERIDLGSRVLFEPELAVGVKLNEKLAAELSWVHVSHATLFSGQNPGMDFIGARVVLKLD